MRSLDPTTKSPRTGQRRGAVLVIENRARGGDGLASCLDSLRVDAAPIFRRQTVQGRPSKAAGGHG